MDGYVKWKRVSPKYKRWVGPPALLAHLSNLSVSPVKKKKNHWKQALPLCTLTYFQGLEQGRMGIHLGIIGGIGYNPVVTGLL